MRAGNRRRMPCRRCGNTRAAALIAPLGALWVAHRHLSDPVPAVRIAALVLASEALWWLGRSETGTWRGPGTGGGDSDSQFGAAGRGLRRGGALARLLRGQVRALPAEQSRTSAGTGRPCARRSVSRWPSCSTRPSSPARRSRSKGAPEQHAEGAKHPRGRRPLAPGHRNHSRHLSNRTPTTVVREGGHDGEHVRRLPAERAVSPDLPEWGASARYAILNTRG